MSLTKPSPNYSNYRPDIDGLRAIAVLSVILFHINKNILPGGFIGVDIFFVISGYLITLHILKDLKKGRFSLIEFYRRRVKRIAPAMLVVILVTILVTEMIYRPSDAEKVAESGLWSLFSMANVYFWLYQDISYFAAASNELPLLHLWSLGVEEQFYIFWPLIMLLTYRLGHGKYFFLTFTIIATASFFFGEYFFNIDPSFTYYMLPTRAGELLVGGLLSQVIMKHSKLVVPPVIITLTATLGAILIAGSLMLLSEEQVFPGLRAIPPTLGAAMLILAGHYGQSWPSRLLMLQPMIWIGMISYSAYLWHWPLLAFYHYSQLEITAYSSIIIFAITILLAWLSYRYVESPARRSRGSAAQIFTRQLIIPSTAIAILAVACMKIDGYGIRWISKDYKTTLASLRDETRPAYEYDYVCQRQIIKKEDITNIHCVIGDETILTPPKAILWGDSNAAHYIGMLGAFSREGGFRFRNLEIGSCPPINSDATNFVTAKRAPDCLASHLVTMQAIDNFPVVIISASWTSYQLRSKTFLDVFYNTVEALSKQGKLIILLGKVPVISNYDRLCKEKAISLPYMKCQTPSAPVSEDITKMNKNLKTFAMSRKNIEYYDIEKYLCPNGACSAYDNNGKPLYYDPSHLTLSASWEIGNDIYNQGGVPFPFTLISDWPETIRPIDQ